MSGAGSAAAATGEADATRAAVAFILASTRQRPQTHAELAGKLRGRGIPPPVADAALATARSLGAVDDEAFARAFLKEHDDVAAEIYKKVTEKLGLVPTDLTGEEAGE